MYHQQNDLQLISFKENLKSFMYSKNNSRSKVEPWGTPHFMPSLEDSKPLIHTYCCRLLKYELISS